MATSTNRVPRKVSDFIAYLNNTADYLSVTPPGLAINYVRLGVTDAQYNTWQNYRAAANALYPKYSDKKESRTTAIKDKLRKVIKDFTLFSRDPLNMIAGVTTSTIDDLEVFHIRAKDLRDSEPSPIHSTNAPVIGLLNKGGAQIDFRTRSTTDQTRASMLRNYQIEVRWWVMEQSAAAPTDPDMAGFNERLSTKAHFILTAGMENLGKKFYCYARWKHLHTADFDGPWSNLMQITIA